MRDFRRFSHNIGSWGKANRAHLYSMNQLYPGLHCLLDFVDEKAHRNPFDIIRRLRKVELVGPLMNNFHLGLEKFGIATDLTSHCFVKSLFAVDSLSTHKQILFTSATR